jgi:hypothetical protein
LQLTEYAVDAHLTEITGLPTEPDHVEPVPALWEEDLSDVEYQPFQDAEDVEGTRLPDESHLEPWSPPYQVEAWEETPDWDESPGWGGHSIG